MDSSKDLGYTDLEWAIGITRTSLKIIGLWPDDKLSYRQKFLANLRAIIICTLLCCGAVIPGLLSLLRVWGDMLAMVDNMQISLPFTIAVMKFVIMWFHKKDLEPIINMVVEDWLKTKTVQERDTMIKQARVARAMVVFGCIMMVFSCIILIIPPCFGYSTRYLMNLTDPGRPMLMQSYFLRDVAETPYYEIIFVAQSMTIVVAAFSYSGTDTFPCLLVFHICGQLEILKERLLNLDSFKDFSTGLAFNMEDHLRIIRSVDVIDTVFNLMLLALLVYFALLFCLQGFLIVNIIDGSGEDVTFMRMCWLVSVLINTFIHMCLYCIVGENLITKAEGIFYAVYNYTWYLRKPNETKSLMLMMVRAGKPLHITAGRMFPMTLSLFCSLIKTSAGYISVLHANV